jgi:transcriptional regulator with XRE-family HTH domain
MTLQDLRREKNLSQKEVAELAKISIPSYWRAEKGMMISYSTAKKICQAFNIDPKVVKGLNIAPRAIKV